jgi:hypothetical protein
MRDRGGAFALRSAPLKSKRVKESEQHGGYGATTEGYVGGKEGKDRRSWTLSGRTWNDYECFMLPEDLHVALDLRVGRGLKVRQLRDTTLCGTVALSP